MMLWYTVSGTSWLYRKTSQLNSSIVRVAVYQVLLASFAITDERAGWQQGRRPPLGGKLVQRQSTENLLSSERTATSNPCLTENERKKETQHF